MRSSNDSSGRGTNKQKDKEIQSWIDSHISETECCWLTDSTKWMKVVPNWEWVRPMSHLSPPPSQCCKLGTTAGEWSLRKSAPAGWQISESQWRYSKWFWSWGESYCGSMSHNRSHSRNIDWGLIYMTCACKFTGHDQKERELKSIFHQMLSQNSRQHLEANATRSTAISLIFLC